jgi:hypothetical protein
MVNKIIIGGALANAHGEAKVQDLVNYLTEGTSDWDICIPQPRPGLIRAAAFDWQGILSTTANLITVGGLIWGAYERFIKPIHDRDKNSKSFLYIVVKHEDGRFFQFSLGSDKLSREDFIELFRRAVMELRLSSDPEGSKVPQEK